ncbi:hypothetical protein B0H13DRAFT_2667568 [Mycena leptocephala]|nr:hypothetical protein B0H13DRAFT_2667568 [Mycena leptocephala]
MSTFPPEVLLRMFSFVRDNETFNEILLTTHQFHALGNEELTRNKYWKKAEDVLPRLEFWRTNPRRHRIQELNFRLGHYHGDHGALHDTEKHILVPEYIPEFDWCKLEVVARAAPPPLTPFTVTHLLLHEVQIVGHDLDLVDIADLFQQGLSLMPPAFLRGLEALSISSDQSDARVVRQAYAILPDTPHLARLRLDGPPSQPALGLAHPSTLVLPMLTEFHGPRGILMTLLRSAVHIVNVAITDEISSDKALAIVAELHPHHLRSIELRLTRWDDEVLCEIAHRFSECKRIKIVHCYGGPSDDFLFDLGPHHLCRMPKLDTLLIHACPEDALEKAPSMRHHTDYSMFFRAMDRWKADGAAGKRAVPTPPSAEAMRVWLAVWTRYTPLLELVELGTRQWARAFQQTVWVADGVVGSVFGSWSLLVVVRVKLVTRDSSLFCDHDSKQPLDPFFFTTSAVSTSMFGSANTGSHSATFALIDAVVLS